MERNGRPPKERTDSQEEEGPTLPASFIAGVFKHLLAEEVCRCEAVCQAWRSASLAPWAHWALCTFHRRCNPHRKQPSPEWLSLRWATSLRNLQRLHLCDLPSCTDLHLQSLPLLTGLRDLELMAMPGVTSATIARVAAACTRIQELALLQLPSMDNNCMEQVGQLPRLWSLKLSSNAAWPPLLDNQGIKALGVLPCLTSLVLTCFPELDNSHTGYDKCFVDEGTFKLIGEQFPNLTWINLASDGPRSYNLRRWNSGFQHLTQLQALESLYLCQAAVNDDAMPFIARITSLTSLSLAFNEHLTPSGLQHLSSLPLLQALDLSDWEYGMDLTDGHLAGLVARLDRALAARAQTCSGSEEEGDVDSFVVIVEVVDLDDFFALETVNVSGSLPAHSAPGPNMRALMEAGVRFRRDYGTSR